MVASFFFAYFRKISKPQKASIPKFLFFSIPSTFISILLNMPRKYYDY